jgi:DNA-binding CsgD family transcriptional regulator
VEQLAEVVHDGLATRKSHGFTMGRPYGWRRQTEVEQTGRKPGIVPVPEEADRVRELAARYLRGDSIRGLTKWLNTLGVPSPRTALRWNHGTVRHILANPVNAGLLAFADEEGQVTYVEAEHYERRLYDPDAFYQVRARMDRNRAQGPRRSANAQYLLGGVVRCGHCGQKLNGRLDAGRQVRLYRCSAGSVRSDPDCTRLAERADAVERVVLDELMRLATDAGVQARARLEIGALLADEQAKVEAEITALRSRLDSLWNDYRFWADRHAKGICLPDEFEVHVADFREAKGQVEARLAELSDQQVAHEQRRVVLDRAHELVGDFAASWEGLSMDERREVLQSVVAEATVSRLPDGRTEVTCTIRGFAPFTRHIGPRAPSQRPATGAESLTPREQAFLYHASQGLPPRDVAKQLGIGAKQVSYQLGRARRKLGAASLEEAWQLAGEHVIGNLQWLPVAGRHRKARAPKPAGPLLTNAHTQLLTLLRAGLTVKAAATQLGISGNTAYVQLKNCRDRLGVMSNDEAVRKAVDLGLVE